MKAIFKSFSMFLQQISKDSMLYMLLAAPVLMGAFFRFGLPLIEAALCRYFGKEVILGEYYLLFDLMLVVMTPYFISFVSAMVMLTEYDENLTSYMAITPVGKSGYLASRLLLPIVFAVILAVIFVLVFHLTAWSCPKLLVSAILSSLLSMVLSLFIVSFSKNRVEGMALAKISGIFLLGLFVPFFIFSNAQYLFSVLPSFWIAKLCTGWSPVSAALLSLFVSILWIGAFYRRFVKKLS